jgi:DNA modification methylase
MIRLLCGDCRDVLRTLPDASVHCVVTSPPYWRLRDYGVAGQIGLEPTYKNYIEQMVLVFREVRRVLRADGTLWLNLGDSYATGTAGARKPTQTSKHGYWENPAITHRIHGASDGLKPKDLCGIPWRVAFAIQADGWWLRQDIIWSKPNPMPESVTDRCTKAHEYLFLLSKSERYYFNAEAIKESAVGTTEHDLTGCGASAPGQTRQNGNRGRASGNKSHKAVTKYESSDSEEHRTKAGLLKISQTAYPKRNKRSVWEVATQPFHGAHFATFPPALIEPCILAGCPKGGTVLDPFGGAGTTGLVADRLQRDAILIELNPADAKMAHSRMVDDAPLFAQVRDGN